MSSGVQMDAEALKAFNDFKMNKTHRYVTLRIVDNSIRVENLLLKCDEEVPKELKEQVQQGKNLDPSQLYQTRDVQQSANSDPWLKNLVNFISDGKPRFIFLDYPVVNKDGTSLLDTLYIIQYIPDKCMVKERMLYASSASVVKHHCQGCKFVQLNDLDDLNGKELQEIYNRTKK